MTDQRAFPWRLPLLLTSLLFIAQAYAVSPLWDAATHADVLQFYLQFPATHLLFAPFFSIADHLTTLGMRQLQWTLAWIALLFIAGFGWARAAVAMGYFLFYAAWIVLVPRPMTALKTVDPEVLIVDFHSHSARSHDGRRTFKAADNIHWHAAQGYHAAFLTDHNKVVASEEASRITAETWKKDGYRSLRGQEVSLYKTHLVVLGNHERIDNKPYDSKPKRVRPFIRDMHRRDYLVIASLPEYWRYHWGNGVSNLVRWGIDGFEITNSAPKALDFPRDLQLEIVDLCRRENLFMTGISDTHGYGYATNSWNAVRLPGWSTLDPAALERRLLATLKKKRFTAVQVIQRRHVRFERGALEWLSPLADAVLYFRVLSLPQTFSWMAWIWGLTSLLWAIQAWRRPQPPPAIR
jgi:predicted metal-dependent phosphoesterase TrpH